MTGDPISPVEYSQPCLPSFYWPTFCPCCGRPYYWSPPYHWRPLAEHPTPAWDTGFPGCPGRRPDAESGQLDAAVLAVKS